MMHGNRCVENTSKPNPISGMHLLRFLWRLNAGCAAQNAIDCQRRSAIWKGPTAGTFKLHHGVHVFPTCPTVLITMPNFRVGNGNAANAAMHFRVFIRCEHCIRASQIRFQEKLPNNTTIGYYNLATPRSGFSPLTPPSSRGMAGSTPSYQVSLSRQPHDMLVDVHTISPKVLSRLDGNRSLHASTRTRL